MRFRSLLSRERLHRRRGLRRPGDEVANNDALGMPIDNNKVEHFGARIEGHTTARHLFREGRIAPQEQLLAGLASRVKSA